MGKEVKENESLKPQGLKECISCKTKKRERNIDKKGICSDCKKKVK